MKMERISGVAFFLALSLVCPVSVDERGAGGD